MSHKLLNPGFLGALGSVSVLPSDFATLQTWWKADSLSLADGTAVGDTGTEWLDETANNKDLTQGTAADRPVFKTAIVGAKPVIRFADSSDFLSFTSTTLSSDWTVMCVVGGISAEADLLKNSGGTREVNIFTGGVNKTGFYNGSTTQSGNVLAVSAASFRHLSWRKNATAVNLNENKSHGGTLTNEASLVMDRIGPGAVMDLAELCVWSTYISDNNLVSLYDNYFKPRWGLP